MKNLQLRTDEAIIIESSSILCVGSGAAYTDDLILTNFNIFWIRKGMFGKIKEIIKWPLEHLKIIDGKPQVRKNDRGKYSSPQLQLFFLNYQYSFEFQVDDDKVIACWIKAIYELFGVAPTKEILEDAEDNMITKAVKGTIRTIRNIFTNDKYEEQHEVNVTRKCIGCMAPLTGVKGSIVKCKYCDTKQTLE